MPVINVSSLTLSQGVRINGPSAFSGVGTALDLAGDVNGDGIDDFILGAPGANTGYVLYGEAGGFAADISLGSLTPADGVRVNGTANTTAGVSVSAAGDVNNDGIGDLLVAEASATVTPAVYVVYGVAGGLADPAPPAAVIFQSGSGAATTRAADLGDANGDGIDDVVVGLPVPGTAAGTVAIIFGQAGGVSPLLNLGQLLAQGRGYTITVDNTLTSGVVDSGFGAAVAGAGDYNGDGREDVLVGAPGASNVFLFYGRASLPPSNPNYTSATFTAADGLKIINTRPGETIGGAIASAGDVNGDGRDDIIIGAPDDDASSATGGSAYVLYAPGVGPLSGPIDLANLSPSQGFRMVGIGTGSNTGVSVAAAGDVNADGIGDVIVGADFAGTANPGHAYVVYGRAGGVAGPINLAFLTDEEGVQFVGATPGGGFGASVSAAGDANGDGFGDVLVGAPGNVPPGGGPPVPTGAAYLLYGPAQAISWTGTAAGEVRSGGILDDVLNGRAGNDSLSGLDGADSLLGGAGLDTLSGGAGADQLDGSNGNDSLAGGADGDTLLGGNNQDTLLGDAGADLLDGSLGNDSLFGGTEGDTLLGGAGNDTLNGGAGVDVMIGGGGTDIFVVDNLGDLPVLSAGAVGSVQAFVSWTLGAGFADLTLIGGAPLGGTGNAGANRLTGNAGGNALAGLDGADTLDGLGGSDSATGGAGNDLLLGGDGADTLVGGEGADTLEGGNGADRLRFAAAPATADTVNGFASATGDRLEVVRAAFDPGGTSGLALGALSAQAGRFEANTTGLATAATTRFVYETDAGSLWWDLDGSGAGVRQLVATLAGAPAVAASDILLV
jgi:Ca2+-binding RTX toxin-like protein